MKDSEIPVLALNYCVNKEKDFFSEPDLRKKIGFLLLSKNKELERKLLLLQHLESMINAALINGYEKKALYLTIFFKKYGKETEKWLRSATIPGN